MTVLRSILALAVIGLMLPAAAQAQGMGQGMGPGMHDDMGADSMPMAFGQPGRADQATRTVEVVMQDNAFSIPSLTVQVGETVKFVLVNKDEIDHEFVIATAAMNAVHREQMAAMDGHGHDQGGHGQDGHGPGPGPGLAQGGHGPGNMAYIPGGQTTELVWTFTKQGELEFACNIPGHYEAGMHGPITIKP